MIGKVEKYCPEGESKISGGVGKNVGGVWGKEVNKD